MIANRFQPRALVGTLRLLPVAFSDAWWCRRQVAAIADLRELLLAVEERAQTRRRRAPDPRDLVRATGLALRVLRAPDRSCVLRSLVHYSALCAAGEPAAFVSGVGRFDGAVDGHAWVESALLPLSLTADDASPTRYAVGFRHPEHR